MIEVIKGGLCQERFSILQFSFLSWDCMIEVIVILACREVQFWGKFGVKIFMEVEKMCRCIY